MTTRNVHDYICPSSSPSASDLHVHVLVLVLDRGLTPVHTLDLVLGRTAKDCPQLA